jgi:AmmeMemoRadiSam system protein A
MPFPERARGIVLDTAWRSIKHGLSEHKPLLVEAEQFEEPLSEPGACFVTLHLGDQLRGCIGSLLAYRPLINDVAENAFAAAFGDSRFAPLKSAELDDLSLQISILSAPERIDFDSEQDLINQIRPGVDGLIFQVGNNRGTFLPAVWKSLPERSDFLRHLKQKAGLPSDYWSGSVEVWRYTTESFGDSEK